MAPGLLTNRDYRLLWLILVTSGLALWLRILVTAQGLLDSEGDPWRVGLIGAIQLVVQIPALLWAAPSQTASTAKRLWSGPTA